MKNEDKSFTTQMDYNNTNWSELKTKLIGGHLYPGYSFRVVSRRKKHL